MGTNWTHFLMNWKNAKITLDNKQKYKYNVKRNKIDMVNISAYSAVHIGEIFYVENMMI